MTGDHDHFRRILNFTDMGQRFEPIHFGEPYVQQNSIEAVLPQNIQTCFATFRQGCGEALFLQYALQRLAYPGLVIHDKNVRHAE